MEYSRQDTTAHPISSLKEVFVIFQLMSTQKWRGKSCYLFTITCVFQSRRAGGEGTCLEGKLEILLCLKCGEPKALVAPRLVLLHGQQDSL